MNENEYIRSVINTALTELQDYDSDLTLYYEFKNDNNSLWVAFEPLQDTITEYDNDSSGRIYFENHELMGAIYLKHSVKRSSNADKQLQDNNGLWQARIKKVIRDIELPQKTQFNDGGGNVYEIIITQCLLTLVNYVADSRDNIGIIRNEIKLNYTITEL